MVNGRHLGVLVSQCEEATLLIWLALLRPVKMKRILCSVRETISFLAMKILDLPNLRSRGMDTGLVLFRDFMDLNPVSVHKNANKKELTQNRDKLAS